MEGAAGEFKHLCKHQCWQKTLHQSKQGVIYTALWLSMKLVANANAWYPSIFIEEEFIIGICTPKDNIIDSKTSINIYWWKMEFIPIITVSTNANIKLVLDQYWGGSNANVQTHWNHWGGLDIIAGIIAVIIAVIIAGIIKA